MMGGELGVESRRNEGSLFWFTVELERRTRRRPALGIADDALRVLVVDDNSSSRRVLLRKLAHCGADAAAAASAAEAMAILEAVRGEESFELVLVDLEMPEQDGLELAHRIAELEAEHRPELVLMTSRWMLGEREILDAGILGTVAKPVRMEDLERCLAALGSGPAAAGEVQSEASEPGRLFEPAAILLVEDNEVNQEVVRGMLETRGCSVEVVSNGAAAEEIVRERTWDLVLMDCQMPIMDGYEATRRIRRAERAGQLPGGGRRARLPIVAMTANAMAGDHERCLAVGMDDYLSKPFTLERLWGVIERWVALEAGHGAEPPPAAERPTARNDDAPEIHAAGDDGPLDPSTFEMFRQLESAGSENLLRRAVQIYFRTSPDLVAAMRDGVASRDPEAVERAAHSLKSSSANLGALRLSRLSDELEERARAQEIDTAQPLVEALESELERVTRALSRECLSGAA